MKIYKTLDSGIIIVEYEDSLAPGVADMWRKSSEGWGGSVGISTAQQVISQHSGAGFYNVYLALDGEEVVGYCSLARYYADKDTLYINTLNVRTDYLGQKIGKALVLLCTERTIELGYPRIDLHTWAGNTAAVPLYKKCGYLWEDRADSTHLVNFMPSILTTALFADFFKKADWYTDAIRAIDTNPDGKQHNKFEIFGYSWAKDGETLTIGYERSGRRMRLIETQDYKIELMAENHELAFGLEYECSFNLENKSGRPLHVKIKGQDDKNIVFDFLVDTMVTGIQNHSGRFHVGAINEPQDKFRVYPSLLADVEINGHSLAFGLGIETKFPLWIEFHRECQVSQLGLEVESYINITSALSQDAKIEFGLPVNSHTFFAERQKKSLSLNITAGGKASIPVSTKVLSMGYMALPISYDITLQDGSSIKFEKDMHLINQGLTHGFSFEDEHGYNIVNGPWKLNLSKTNNEVSVSHLTMDYKGWFEPPKLGKPYDDEFNLAKPQVCMYEQGGEWIIEAEFISEKFVGLAITQILSLSAVGLISRRHRIYNRAEMEKQAMICDSYWLHLHHNTVIPYDGGVAQNFSSPQADSTRWGHSDLDPEKIDENWIFEADTRNPRGFCWPNAYKPLVKWGRALSFEIDAGTLVPGQRFETEPIYFAYGLFANYNDFRNFAMKQYRRIPDIASPSVELCLNGNNPFISSEACKFEVIDNRSAAMEGQLCVSSPDNLFAPQSQENSTEIITTRNIFDLSLTSPTCPIGRLSLRMHMALYDKSYTRAMFFSRGEISGVEEDGVYSVSNGCITFKASPDYAGVLYSLSSHDSDGEKREWLASRYPNHEPFAWWNPFIGGIQVNPPGMNPATLIKERVKASFVKMSDNFCNEWFGIRTTLEVQDFDELKGAVYESYFLSLPGLPVLCNFFRFINGTGVFKEANMESETFLKISENIKSTYVEAMNKDRIIYRIRAGTSDQDVNFDGLVKFISDDEGRKEKLYIYHKAQGDDSHFWVDINAVCAVIGTNAAAAPGRVFTSRPTFYIVTERDLTVEALTDLERICFNENH